MTTPSWLRADRPIPEFFTPERCFIAELHNDPETPGTSLARARVEPGVTTQLHALAGVLEIYVIEAGEGEVEIDGETAEVGPGDRVVIAPDTPQRIANTGPGDLVFLCLCAPRFTPEAYVTLGP
ncbi:cupin domain-containing protein [Pelagibacterium montanilacus]|uniref:cupin domain-containing protein n=1 Tax=Pelagibacterium montanilacus TaxID=2185280 RepID=UPI000F8E4BDB|nr:cupin domain-containing protein [Pelagibacterium montanilacus]